MSENKSDKRTIWLYAVLLFTGAFVILLLTAYSQMKIQKNSNEFENQISNEVKAKNSIKTDLKSALDENKKLKGELSSLKADIDAAKEESKSGKQTYEEQTKKFDRTIAAYESVIAAEDQYSKGNVVESALVLKNTRDTNLLGTAALQKYNELVDVTFTKASRVLYQRGYKDYRNENYESAINELHQSLSLSQNEYFSDDCYFFIGYSAYNMGNMDQAKDALNKLLQQYQGSNFMQDAVALLNKIQ